MSHTPHSPQSSPTHPPLSQLVDLCALIVTYGLADAPASITSSSGSPPCTAPDQPHPQQSREQQQQQRPTPPRKGRPQQRAAGAGGGAASSAIPVLNARSGAGIGLGGMGT